MKKTYAITFGFLFSVQFLTAQSTQTFNYTGSVQTFTVPACVTSLTVDVSGAKGGASGGNGGRVQGAMSVTPGEVLNIYVGGMGGAHVTNSAGGYNGGGTGGTCSVQYAGAGGGGASDIRRTPYTLNDRIVVGGGGGGSHPINSTNNGGAGGGLTGGNVIGNGNTCMSQWATGGSQTTGGSSSTWSGTCCSFTVVPGGSFGIGGNGAGPGVACNGGDSGAGGGGGWYGGGGGGTYTAGGGGSSYTASSVSAVVHSQGFQTGNGQVLITTSSGIPSPGPITGSATLCFNGTANYSIASMVGATSYNWTVPPGSTINSGQGTTSINITAGSTSGNISVTATFSCGTSTPTTLALTISQGPTVGATATPSNNVCTGATVTLSGTGATSYTWSGGITNGVPFVIMTTTTYTVTGSNSNGCTGTATITITVNPSLSVTSSATPSNNICNGSSVTLTGIGASSYTWTGGVLDGIPFVPNSSGTYTVTGTDINGCIGTSTQTITLLPLPQVSSIAFPSTTVCVGSSVTLNGSGASSYSWTGGVTNGIPFVPAVTTTYTVTGVGPNGCSNTATTTITVNPLPIISFNIFPSATVCAGTSVVLSGTGASTYVWSGGVTNAVPFIANSTNSYTVTGTDAIGCTNTAIATVNVNPLPTVTASSTANSICIGSSITLTGSGAATYAWSGGVINAFPFIPAVTTTYTVTGTNSIGCSNTATITVVVYTQPVVTASASSIVVCLSDANVTLTGSPTGGTWSGQGVVGNSFNPLIATTGSHAVSYFFTDVHGCTNTAIVTITVNPCVGLEETILANGVSVYPNPNNGNFTLGVSANVDELVIKITDIQGRVVYVSVDNKVNAGFVKQISLDSQPSGMYLMQILANGEQTTEKISINK